MPYRMDEVRRMQPKISSNQGEMMEAAGLQSLANLKYG